MGDVARLPPDCLPSRRTPPLPRRICRVFHCLPNLGIRSGGLGPSPHRLRPHPTRCRISGRPDLPALPTRGRATPTPRPGFPHRGACHDAGRPTRRNRSRLPPHVLPKTSPAHSIRLNLSRQQTDPQGRPAAQITPVHGGSHTKTQRHKGGKRPAFDKVPVPRCHRCPTLSACTSPPAHRARDHTLCSTAL